MNITMTFIDTNNNEFKTTTGSDIKSGINNFKFHKYHEQVSLSML